uniref:Uncharacterized protein n=1 Tax=Aegilops tauschii subsp. strangulata TaxID=200361 RepID=A0A453R1W0_AEGTS
RQPLGHRLRRLPHRAQLPAPQQGALLRLRAQEQRAGEPSGRVSLSRAKDDKGTPKVIDAVKLRKMKQERISAWTMKGLITAIRSSRLSTISQSIESFHEFDETEQKDKEITSEWEAKAAANAIFKNVARPGYK